jgi:cyclopropane-fatty-acyl-phospholipid synthase
VLRHLINPSLDSIGQAYVQGKLDAEGDLDSLFEAAASLARHAGKPASFFDRLDRLIRAVRHTRDDDAKAIAYHYDVSNEFYRLWLDANMVYSCAYFRNESDSLELAQMQKIDHVLRKICLRPGQRLLDIGCGWGALILRAAEKYGVHATGITLSKNQYELARERIAEAGLADRCQVLLSDYRDMTGKFDRITSIGMFEHVGLKNLRGYFSKINELLSDGGIVLNHGITSTDPESGEVGWGGGSFIDRYVFPHGELPHISLALKEMSASGLEAVDVENLRRHYVATLRHWTRRFEAAADRIRTMIGESRYRIWSVYLAGCAYAFEHSWTAVHQVLAVKAGEPGATPLPLIRDYMYRDSA